MAINIQTQNSVSETSVQALEETCFKVRKESTISHYEVSDGRNSWWECIFYSENWGTFNSAVKRYCGFNCTPYKNKLSELVKVLEEYGIRAELSPDNYKLILMLDNKANVRVDYAVKNRGSAPKESDGELGSGSD